MGSRARTKGGKRLQQLAETAATHEIIFLVADAAHGPQANANHDGEVGDQNEVIDRAA